MPVVPRGFDEDAPQMAVARFRDAALRTFGATRVLGGHEADKRHGAGGGRKAPWVAELGGDGERGQVVDAAEAAQPLYTRTERFEIEQGAEILFNGAKARDGFLDGAQIRAVGLIEGGDRPRLCAKPHVVALGPGPFGPGEPTA